MSWLWGNKNPLVSVITVLWRIESEEVVCVGLRDSGISAHWGLIFPSPWEIRKVGIHYSGAAVEALGFGLPGTGSAGPCGICSLCQIGRAMPWWHLALFSGTLGTRKLCCEKPSGYSHVIFQNSVRCCMGWCFSQFIPSFLCSRSGCKLVPCMVVLPDRLCGAIGGVQAQQEGCLLLKCGLLLWPKKDKHNQMLNT